MIGYLRVSTDGQAQDGYGLDAQRDAIQSEADRRGWTVLFIEDAGRSGKNIKRPGLTQALALLKKREYDGLVVAKLDRLARSMKDTADVMERAEKQGWSLVALDLGLDMTTPAGELVANIMAAVARWERRMISVRTKDGLAVARSKGVRLGSPVLVPAEVVQRVVSLRAEGKSYAAIAAVLNDDGVPCAGRRQGARWYGSTVRAICQREEAA